MKKWMKIGIPVAAVAILIAWYAFRPERLVVNRQVDEAMPTTEGGSSPQRLEAGQFYSILHPTSGTATIYQMGDGTRVLRFTDFTTSNGPDVHVYMVAADDAKNAAAGGTSRLRRSGSDQGQHRRPELHAWQRLGPGEIPRRVHMVQTIPREFWGCAAKADRDNAKSIGHGWSLLEGSTRRNDGAVGEGWNRTSGVLQQLHGRAPYSDVFAGVWCNSLSSIVIAFSVSRPLVLARPRS